jgi:transglutaminase-like putative cysteine protease
MARPLPADTQVEYLAERLPHIAFTPEIRRTVNNVVGSETDPLVRARHIFEFIDREIRYCAEEEYSIIPSFATKALELRRGDCGIHSMLFITMCRAAGIPARWQSGWTTRPEAWNMHDWAEFYVEPWGWLPADTSLGLQDSEDPRIRAFYFGHLDAYRLIVNLDYGALLHPPENSLRSEPADFQRGEVEIDGRNLYFDEWDWQFDPEVKPLDGPPSGPE